jgi:hypothetical protein
MPCNRPGEKNTTRISDTDCGFLIRTADCDTDCGLRSQRARGRAGPFARGLALGNGAAAWPGADLPGYKKSTKGFCDHHNSFRMVTALMMLMYAALRI